MSVAEHVGAKGIRKIGKTGKQQRVVWANDSLALGSANAIDSLTGRCRWA
jgi:hypothetical protein